MAVVNYHTVNGRIRGESTSGVRTDYLTDALGSVVATVNSSATVVNTYRYKPYGALLAKTGAGADPRFQWTGTSGSRTTSAAHSEQYNRARHYSQSVSGWLSVDPMCPSQASYAYVACNPTSATDPSGLYDHSLNIRQTKVGCCSFEAIWQLIDLQSRRELFLKQLADVSSTCWDCDKKKPCKEQFHKVHRLEIFKFRTDERYKVLFLQDVWGLTGPNRGGGRTYSCTRGSMTLVATYDVLTHHSYPPPSEGWAPLTYLGVITGYKIENYQGKFKGSLTHKLVYEWDCCLRPAWTRLTASATLWTHDKVFENPKPKPKKERKCPEEGGTGGGQ